MAGGGRNARFGTISGTIDFDPAHTTAAKFEFTADTRSLTSADKDFEKKLKGATCFNASHCASLFFQSDSTSRDPMGNLLLHVTGRLSICGVSRTVKFALVATSFADGYVFRGTVSLKLSEFGLDCFGVNAMNSTFFVELRAKKQSETR